MRNIKTAPLLLLSILVLSEGKAETYNASQYREHGSWDSLMLSLGSERFYRAINTSSYSDTFLAVDYYDKKCTTPRLNIRVDSEEVRDKTEVINVLPMQVRVDRNTTHKTRVEISTERGDDGFYLAFSPASSGLLLNEMKKGSMVRFRIEMDNPFYLEFGLNGSMAAINRAGGLCRSNDKSPADFFSDDVGGADYFQGDSDIQLEGEQYL